jgi:iron complex outermembrane receptor protein
MNYLINFSLKIYLISLLLFSYNAYSKSNDLSVVPDLKNVEIISVSKEKESVFKAASSVYVLSSDDIRRSGATNIPEALRLVPGIEVSRAGSSKWSVTSRGFGRLYDNKVLVMIDGREMYSSVFSGTNWDITDVVLEDVDRIEVVRGGSTTTWGANSLNGVIHIITKKAQYTQGGYVSALYGNKERSLEYRQGGKSGDNIFYRAYAKKSHRDGLKSIDYLRGNQFADAGDEWGMAKTGFRVDWQKTLRDEVTFQGDAHDGKEDQILYIPTRENRLVYDSEHVSGFNLDSRWKHTINKTDSFNLHSYIDLTSRKSQLFSLDRTIFNLDGEYHVQTSDRNKLKLGFGYRNTDDEMKNGVVAGILVNQFTPNKQNTNLYNAFVQDNYSIIPEKLDLTLGGKFEHHYITGSHFLPSAQLRWTPDRENTIWTSYSEGIREPSKLETNLKRLTSNLGPAKIYWQGNPDFKAEQITSYEAGYRNRSFDRVELDLSVFYNEYKNVRTFEPNFAKLQYELYNRARSRTEGINTSANISVLNNWNVVLGYSYIDMDLKYDPNSADTLSPFDAGVSPRHQFQVQSRYNLTSNIDIDATFYYYSGLHTVFIEDYKRTDLRVAWRPIKNLELSIVGQKLFYGDTRETTRPFYGTHNATYGNQVYGNVKWTF